MRILPFLWLRLIAIVSLSTFKAKHPEDRQTSRNVIFTVNGHRGVAAPQSTRSGSTSIKASSGIRELQGGSIYSAISVLERLLQQMLQKNMKRDAILRSW
jgi:hypothetical protein